MTERSHSWTVGPSDGKTVSSGFDQDQAGVCAGEARGGVGADHEGVLEADHADGGDAFLGFERDHLSLDQRRVESVRQDWKLVDLQADAVAEEVGTAVCEAHEVLEEIRGQGGHDGRMDLRGDGAGAGQCGQLVLDIDALSVDRVWDNSQASRTGIRGIPPKPSR